MKNNALAQLDGSKTISYLDTTYTDSYDDYGTTRGKAARLEPRHDQGARGAARLDAGASTAIRCFRN